MQNSTFITLPILCRELATTISDQWQESLVLYHLLYTDQKDKDALANQLLPIWRSCEPGTKVGDVPSPFEPLAAAEFLPLSCCMCT